MNEETPEQFRQRVEQLDGNFFEQFGKRGAPMLDRAFEYEKLAVGYSEKGFQSLTYLNGGALVAIPTAMTFFKAEVARGDVVWMAVAFVVGLTCVVVAQAAAFMTMARRSEAQIRFAYGQFHRVAALQYQHGTPENVKGFAASDAERTAGNNKNRRSNIWWCVGVFFLFLSLVAFITGCWWGARAVIFAKEKVASVAVEVAPV